MKRTLAALLMLAAACRADAPGDAPRLSGRDACARCGMAVTEARFAAGWVDEKGESVLFDDAGELLTILADEPGRASDAWVGDLESGRWIRVAQAFFVRAPGLATPMGTGVAAFASSAAAEAFLRTRPGAQRLRSPAQP